jgi:hypothetical protein
MKTDNIDNVGRHAWEVSGLGIAPFRFAGFEHKIFKAHPDAPAQPGGTCSICGAAISNICWVKSADGRTFMTGPDCVRKAGEDGLLKAYTQSPEVRKAKRDARHAREAIKAQELRALIDEHAAWLSGQPHPYGYHDRQTGRALTLLDSYEWMFNACGGSGKVKLLRGLRRLLEERG